MKRLSNLLAALVFASLVIFMSCGGGGSDPAPDPLIEKAAQLTGTAWAVTSSSTVQTDGGDADGDWSSFGINFTGNESGGNYTVSGVPEGFGDVWSDGTWTFASASVVTKVQGGVTTNMSATIAEGSLTLVFEVDDPNGRTNGIGGQWTFVF